MKRHVPGLSETAHDSHSEVPDGIFLVRLDGAQHGWQAQKRFYMLRLSILEPKAFVGRSIVSRLYCTPKAMWKLGWFLRDFLYDPELLSQDEVDERALRGLVGVVKISHTVVVSEVALLANPLSNLECGGCCGTLYRAAGENETNFIYSFQTCAPAGQCRPVTYWQKALVESRRALCISHEAMVTFLRCASLVGRM